MTMKEISSSASKIVFILIAIAVIGAVFLGKISGEQFLMLAGSVFTFYFSNKGTEKDDYLGK